MKTAYITRRHERQFQQEEAVVRNETLHSLRFDCASVGCANRLVDDRMDSVVASLPRC